MLARWNDAEGSPEVQKWANVGIAGAYGLLALIAAVSV